MLQCTFLVTRCLMLSGFLIFLAGMKIYLMWNERKVEVTASYDLVEEKAILVQVASSKEAMEKICRHCVELRVKKWNLEKILDKFPRFQDGKRRKLTPVKNIVTETGTDSENASDFFSPSPVKPSFDVSLFSSSKVVIIFFICSA